MYTTKQNGKRKIIKIFKLNFRRQSKRKDL